MITRSNGSMAYSIRISPVVNGDLSLGTTLRDAPWLSSVVNSVYTQNPGRRKSYLS